MCIKIEINNFSYKFQMEKYKAVTKWISSLKMIEINLIEIYSMH